MENLIPTNKIISSREIAELTGKQHRHLFRDINELHENYEKLGWLKIEPTPYTHPQNNRTFEEYFLTRIR